MKSFEIFLVIFAVASASFAQQTRIEVSSPPSVANDSRPNNNAVPESYAVSGQFDRILVLRLKYQTDLLAGIESAAKQNGIRNAVILSGIGSVRNYRFHVVGNRTFPTKNIFVSDSTGPADIANMNGYIINGRVHAHIMLSNDKSAFGGHLESGTNVFTFAIITVGVLSDSIDISRVDDSNYR